MNSILASQPWTFSTVQDTREQDEHMNAELITCNKGFLHKNALRLKFWYLLRELDAISDAKVKE